MEIIKKTKNTHSYVICFDLHENGKWCHMITFAFHHGVVQKRCVATVTMPTAVVKKNVKTYRISINIYK